jgi:hypothetical protein
MHGGHGLAVFGDGKHEFEVLVAPWLDRCLDDGVEHLADFDGLPWMVP